MSVSQRMGTIYPGAPGATGRQARARSLAEHATANTTEEANDRCRTPDDSTAEYEHSDHNRTTPATRQAPAWAPFTFQGLSSQPRHTAHGRFVKARPAQPTSTRLHPPPCAHHAIRRFNRRADEKAHGVVRCPRAVPHGKIGGTIARTAECAAPEGSQDRDEWMTVIEMQDYMRASRNKAYDLIWSGEIDSYRLGRKLLVSRASVDAYIESRSGRK